MPFITIGKIVSHKRRKIEKKKTENLNTKGEKKRFSEKGTADA